jgi:hypothetical protein
VSCVLEHVVRSHRPGDLERILGAGDCVVIMTSCEERLVAAEMMTRFPVPVLHVDTTADQDPDIDTIIEFVTAVPGAGPSGRSG